MSYTQYYKQEKYVNGSPTGEYRRGDATGEVFDEYEDCTTNTHYRWITVEGDYYCDGHDKYAKQKQQKSINGGAWTDTGTFRHGDLIERDSEDCLSKMYRWKDTNDVVCDGDFLCYKAIYQQSTDGGTTWTNVEPLQYGIGQGIEAHSSICTQSNGNLWQAYYLEGSSSQNFSSSLTSTGQYDETNTIHPYGSSNYHPYTFYYNGTPAQFITYSYLHRVGYIEFSTTSLYQFFHNSSPLTYLNYVDMRGWDFSNIRNVHGMFDGNENVIELNADGCDFRNPCNYYNSTGGSPWPRGNTDNGGFTVFNVNNTKYGPYVNLMFSGVNVDVLDLSTAAFYDSWYAYAMFRDCKARQILLPSRVTVNPPSDADSTAKITRFDEMFRGCTNISSIDLSPFSGKSTSFLSTFRDCSSLTTVDLSGFTVPTKDLDGGGKTVEWGDIYKGCDFTRTFQDCKSLRSVNFGAYPVLRFDTSVSPSSNGSLHYINMFMGCSSLEEVIIDYSNLQEIDYTPAGLPAEYQIHFTKEETVQCIRDAIKAAGLTAQVTVRLVV